MADIFPPEMTSPIGRMRKYVPDLVLLEDPHNPEADPSYYFSDEEVLGFLSEYKEDLSQLKRWDIKRAAADAIDALANNEALVLKKIVTDDLQTDGAAVANSLRQGARALRERAAQEERDENVFAAVIPFTAHHHPRTRIPGRFW